MNPVEVWVVPAYPHYLVMVDGAIYDEFTLRSGPRLTHSQMVDIASGYREGLSERNTID